MLSKLILLQISEIDLSFAIQQINQRLKITSFDICSTYIALGSNSGTLYFLHIESMHILYQLPTQNGRIVEISISPDEGFLAYATSNGNVFITKVPGQDSSLNIHPASSSEHEGSKITVLAWSSNGSDLYIGDKNGNLSVLHAPSSFASSLLMNLTHHLMYLESCIVQLDVHDHYLLVSTITKSFVCNTRLETYSQIGTKPRNGVFGGCFCSVEPQRILRLLSRNPNIGINSADAALTSETVMKENAGNRLGNRAYSRKRVISGECDLFDDCNIMNLRKMEARIFCSRPGSRLWESDLKGKVLATHQLKRALSQPPSPVIDMQKDILNAAQFRENCKNFVTSHVFTQISLKHVVKFYDDYIIATSAAGLHLIDPQQSKIILWTLVAGGVESIKVHSNVILYKTSTSGHINKLIITTADIAILTLHSKGLYEKCAAMCIKYASLFESSHLLKQFGKNIIKDLLSNLENKEIIQEIDNVRRNLVASDLIGYRITSSCIRIEKGRPDSCMQRNYCSYDRLTHSHTSDGEFFTPEESSIESSKTGSHKQSEVADSCGSNKNENVENMVRKKLEMKMDKNDENLISVGDLCSKPIQLERKNSPLYLENIFGNITSSWVSSFASSTKSLRNTLKESLSFKKTEEFMKKLDPSVLNGHDVVSTFEEVTVFNVAQVTNEESIVIIPASKKNKQCKKSFKVHSFTSEVELKKNVCEIPSCLITYQSVVSETREKVPFCESHSELEEILMEWLMQYLVTVNDLKARSFGGFADNVSDFDSDINFECPSISGLRKECTKLFILCFKRRIYLDNIVTNLNWHSEFSQHFLTPESTKLIDSFYATIIENDLGFLNYSIILDNLTSINSNLLYHSWIALMKKVTDIENNYITEIELTRLHRLQNIKKLLINTKSLNDFLSAASNINHSTVLYDIFYLTLYLSSSNGSQSVVQSSNINIVLNRFLKEVSNTQNILALYLMQWSECPEIQYEIIASLLSFLDEEANRCHCGFPIPAGESLMYSKILRDIFNLPIYHPFEVATLCQGKGFFYGVVFLNLKYQLCDLKNVISIALQTCYKSNITLLFEYLNEKDEINIFRALYELKGSSNHSLRCLKCSSILKIYSSEDLNNMLSNDEKDVCLYSEKDTLNSYTELWDFVLSNLLQYKGSWCAMQLLANNLNIVPREAVKKTIFGKLIMSSLFEMVAANFHSALMQFFTGAPRFAISLKVMTAFDVALLADKHTSALVTINSANNSFKFSAKDRNADSSECIYLSKKINKFTETCNEDSYLSDTTILPRQMGTSHSGDSSQLAIPPPPVDQHPYSHRFSHHWGIKVQILNGICQLCRLGLTVEAMVNAGGLTVFSCGHAYHTVCLHQHGRSCVLCVNLA